MLYVHDWREGLTDSHEPAAIRVRISDYSDCPNFYRLSKRQYCYVSDPYKSSSREPHVNEDFNTFQLSYGTVR